MLKGVCTTVAAPLLSVVTGTVQDASTGEAVIGAAVILQNTTYGAVANADGRFVINNVKPGTYTIEVQMLSYQRIVIEGCQIKPGENTLPLISLQPSAEEIDEVVVTTVRRLSSEAAVMQAVRNSKMVVSGVSKQMIARTQDRDAGEVVRRIPGISIIDDKFIVARGLSQRYNNVWVNDAAIPSSEADSRAFSFDLIPAGQIENIMILKSPVPEIPADFTGGFVKINTKDTPGELPFALSYSIGFNTATFGHDFLYNPGSGSDWFGCDNGKRGVRGGITGAFDNDDPDFVTDMTRHGFNNDWSIKTRKPIPDQRFSFSYGHSFRLGNGADLALNGALNYSYATRTFSNMENSRYGVYNKVEDKPEYYYKYTDDQYQTNVKVGALLNLAYLNGKNRYYFRNIFNQIGQDKLTLREGWQNMSSLYIQEKTEYCYTSRSTYSGQIAGVHTLELGTLDWDAGYSYADKNQPDRRIVNRQENDMVGDAHYGQMQIDQNEIRRDFMKLREHIASAGINYSCTLREGSSFAPELKVGLYGEYRTRDYRTRAYFYRFDTDNLPADFAYGDVIDDILQDGNYGADKLYIYDDSDNRNSYKGDNILTAAYAGIDLPFGRWNVYAGVRFEYSRMALTSYTKIKDWDSETRNYTHADPFPSVNVTYRINDKHLLRAAYGMSTNRPEFREVSPSVYYDFDLFSDVKGNADLKAAYIQNADLRWEWYPAAGEGISVAVFYKHFRNPIETAILDAGSGSYTYTFENADRANLYGVELDVKKNLDFMGMRNFSVVLNGSLMKSRVDFDDESLEHDRPLQGQSPYLVNAGLFYQSPKLGLTVGVLYNRIGKRIVGIGRSDMSVGGSIDNDIPDMYEMPRNALDVVVSKSFGKHWELKFNAKDLLNEKVQFAQFPKFENGGDVVSRKQITKQFTAGRMFSLSVTAKF